MHPKTKADFHKIGADLAYAGVNEIEVPYQRANTSWQSRAVWSGYDDMRGALTRKSDTVASAPAVTVEDQEAWSAAMKDFSQIEARAISNDRSKDVMFPGATTGRFPRGWDAGRGIGIDLATKESESIVITYTGGRRQMGKSIVQGMSLPAVITVTQWPEGAQSHYFDLKRQYHNERDIKRKARLWGAMTRLWARWTKA